MDSDEQQASSLENADKFERERDDTERDQETSNVANEVVQVEIVRKLLPHPERPLSRYVDCFVTNEERCEELSSWSNAYILVKTQIEDTLNSIDIHKIVKLYNPYMKGCYLLRKSEYISRKGSVTEKVLFHATNEGNIQNSIIKENLDWRRAYRCKFGKGVSFANTARYANLECGANRGSQRTRHRAMIVAKVLVGDCIEGNYTELPNRSYDTTTGWGSVYVKYYDHEFYPEYIAYYTS